MDHSTNEERGLETGACGERGEEAQGAGLPNSKEQLLGTTAGLARNAALMPVLPKYGPSLSNLLAGVVVKTQ